MDPALLKLIRLQARGFVRRMLRGATSPRRAIFLVLGLVVLLLWLGPLLVTGIAIQSSHAVTPSASAERVRTLAPLALLGVCLLTIVSSAGDRAIAFTPAEVDMLFPGPFSRRQLLGYKLLKSALGAMLTSLFLSVAFLPYATSWLVCYIGMFLTLQFIQLFSTAGVLLGQAISQRAYTMVRRVALVGLVVLGLLFARHWAVTRGGSEAIYAFRDSAMGEVILKPFDPFGRAITAAPNVDFLPAAGEAALIDAGLLALVILLDANYMEAALGASRRRYEQMRRIRGGALLSRQVKGEVKWHLPRLPWAGGAGPIAWRQATTAARSAKGLLFVLLIVAIGIGPVFASVVQSSQIVQPLVAGIAWLTVLLSGLLKFDFRGDLDHIDQLKALPLRPAAVAAGQVVVPTVILTAAHILLLLSVATMVRSQRSVLIVAACLALPFNGLLMTTENLIFLLFPTRPAAASPGDFQVLGRQAAQLVMKAIAVMIGCLIAFAAAAPIFIVTGGSLPALTLIAWALLAAEACALVPAIAWAYNRFDPSVDTPA